MSRALDVPPMLLMPVLIYNVVYTSTKTMLLKSFMSFNFVNIGLYKIYLKQNVPDLWYFATLYS